MTSIFEEMQQFFQAEEWHAYPLKDQPVLELNYQSQNGRWTCYAHAREEQQQFLFHSVCSAAVPPELRPAVSEYITRANWGLALGNFEMDWQDGEVRFKTGIDVEGDRISTALIRQVVYANVLTMERYLPGIMAVRFGGISAEEAFAQVELAG